MKSATELICMPTPNETAAACAVGGVPGDIAARAARRIARDRFIIKPLIENSGRRKHCVPFTNLSPPGIHTPIQRREPKAVLCLHKTITHGQTASRWE